MESRQEIKKQARDLLGNKMFEEKWLMMLLFLFIYSLVISISFGSSYSTYGFSIAISLLLGGALDLGFTRGMIGVIKKQDDKADIQKLFSGFDKTYTTTLILNLMRFLEDGATTKVTPFYLREIDQYTDSASASVSASK